MKNRLIGAAVLAMLLCGAGTATLAATSAAVRLNNLGSDLLKAEKFAEAAAEFQQAVQQDPTFAAAQLNLAYCYDKLGKADEAIAAYEKAIALEAKNATAFNNLGVLYMKQADYDKAIQTFERGLSIDGSSVLLQQNLANARNNRSVMQDREAKIAEAKKLAAARPRDPEAARHLARTYAFYGHPEAALEWIAKTIQLGFGDLESLKVDPVFVGLREDPRFVQLVGKR
jgi:superkiller protein 3